LICRKQANIIGVMNSPKGIMEGRNQDSVCSGTTLFDRRAFIKIALASAAFSGLKPEAFAANQPTIPHHGLIDTNINISRWPLRRVRYDDTEMLASMLRHQGVAQAWTGSFDALLHKDIGSLNARLADDCRRHGHGLLLPFGSINPKSPDWEEELRRCAQEHKMIGIRLNPNYHGYKLEEPDFVRLLRLATDFRLIVQIALLMEDERMMHPMLRAELVDIAPLAGVVKNIPALQLVLLNAAGKLHGQSLTTLLAAGNVFVEISMLEGVGGISNLLTQVPLNRVLFGSYAPLFYFESALLKLKESPLDNHQLEMIGHGNAKRLVSG
jgi:predicted TIM-barrel fold metal-dependent hydrolase